MRRRNASSSAQSPCISPSISSPGSRSRIKASACCIFAPDCELPEPKFERDSKAALGRSEEHTSELQSLMRISYAVFCLKKKNYNTHTTTHTITHNTYRHTH